MQFEETISTRFPASSWNSSVGPEGSLSKLAHPLFVIPLSHPTCSNRLRLDKDALRELILALWDKGMSYRMTNQEVGLHWTRVA